MRAVCVALLAAGAVGHGSDHPGRLGLPSDAWHLPWLPSASEAWEMIGSHPAFAAARQKHGLAPTLSARDAPLPGRARQRKRRASHKSKGEVRRGATARPTQWRGGPTQHPKQRAPRAQRQQRQRRLAEPFEESAMTGTQGTFGMWKLTFVGDSAQTAEEARDSVRGLRLHPVGGLVVVAQGDGWLLI